MIKGIYPDIIIRAVSSVNISDFLAYKTILLDPKHMDIDGIILNRICSKCGRKMQYTDCFNKEKQQVSLIRTCHNCYTIFLLNGKCSSIYQYDYIFDYFKKMRMVRWR